MARSSSRVGTPDAGGSRRHPACGGTAVLPRGLLVVVIVAALIAASAAPALGPLAADCNGNFRPDTEDVAAGRSADCNSNGVPDECEAAIPLFAPALPYEIGGAPGAVVAADLDADGDTDVAVSIPQEGSLDIFLNDRVVFHPPARLTLAPLAGGATRLAPTALVAADLDGDGDTDLIAGCARRAGTSGAMGSLAVLTNVGRWPLSQGQEVIVDPDPSGLVAADLDGDGLTDLAASSRSAKRLSIALQEGDGVFSPAAFLSAPGTSECLSAGDVDADGDVDLVVALRELPFAAWFRNRGDGTFGRAEIIEAGPSPSWIAPVDFDGDGTMDLLAASAPSSSISLLRGDASGGFSLAWAEVVFQGLPSRLSVPDLDGDGDPDLVAGRSLPGALFVFPNDRGRIEPGPVRDLGTSLVGMAHADLDGDGLADLLAVGSGSGPGFDRLHAFVNAGSWKRDCNGNGVLDACDVAAGLLTDPDLDEFPDECALRVSFGSADPRPLFHRGDANGDGQLNLTDAVLLFRYLFDGAGLVDCLEAADADDDGSVVITDGISILDHAFRGGQEPAPPGPPGLPCGPDPDRRGSAGDLGCEAYRACR